MSHVAMVDGEAMGMVPGDGASALCGHTLISVMATEDVFMKRREGGNKDYEEVWIHVHNIWKTNQLQFNLK